MSILWIKLKANNLYPSDPVEAHALQKWATNGDMREGNELINDVKNANGKRVQGEGGASIGITRETKLPISSILGV